ncbi:MAG: hypothetical protein K2Y29_12730 [Beijerinckiaceae bacterium]|nr:hypothetical protein [Beijerinckiaceae bacterium]
MVTSGKFAGLLALLLASALGAGAAFSQAPAPAPARPPAASPTEKPADKTDESDTLRIRGQVESADASGVTVLLSQGLSIRVDIAPDTPVFSAARISQGDLAAGAEIGVRTLAPPASGENSLAADVLSFAMPAPADMGSFSVRGAYKSIDKSGEKPLLVVTEGGADRRLR